MKELKKIKDISDIINLINILEIKFKPQLWKYKSIDLWPILRILLYHELSLKVLGIKSNRTTPIEKILRIINALLKGNRKYKAEGEVLLISDGNSYINMNNKLYDRFCDPIIEILEKERIKWDKWNFTGRLNGLFYFNPKKINPNIDLILILSKFLKKKIKCDIPLDKFCEFINDYTKNDVNWSVEGIKKQILKFEKMVFFFKNILVKSKLKKVIIVGFYSDRGMALINACQELQIKISDLQHGVQGEFQGAYGFWNLPPKIGYNTLPNEFLVWSNNEKEILNKLEIDTNKNNKCIIIGNLFESKWHNNYDNEVVFYDKIFLKFISKMKSKKTILFTLQYGMKYSNDLFELIKNTENDFNWLIRFHPLSNLEEKKSIINALKKMKIENVEFEISSKIPIYCILRNINLHLTHSSATVFESIDFGIKSLIISEENKLFFTNYLENMVFVLSNYLNAKDLIEFLLVEPYNKKLQTNIPTNSYELIRKYLFSET